MLTVKVNIMAVIQKSSLSDKVTDALLMLVKNHDFLRH